ncbi:MAG: M28 family peptidase [bacterium]
MTSEVAERLGVRHLAVLAQRARPAGSPAERSARAYAAEVLTAAGFVAREKPFAYSEFPGRYATPLAGSLLAASIVTADVTAGRFGAVGAASIALAGGVVATMLFARLMFASVLSFPWLRADGVNLVATRGSAPTRVWLVAHLDSKSQPIPSLVRVMGVLLLVAGLALAGVALAVTLGGHDIRTLWWGSLVATLFGAVPVMLSVVGHQSDGAVDNASGAATVLLAAAMLPTGTACGVLLTSAEELGLAGARAWLGAQDAPCVVLNCDGVDDEGDVVIMFNGTMPPNVVNALRAAAVGGARVRRMPLGLLTDSSAFSAAGWPAVTVSHGSLATLRRIHTRRDTLANLNGTAIDRVAAILARAVEELAQ